MFTIEWLLFSLGSTFEVSTVHHFKFLQSVDNVQMFSISILCGFLARVARLGTGSPKRVEAVGGSRAVERYVAGTKASKVSRF